MINRTANILEALVDGFINTGEPISSGWLYDNYDFGIKPAMIRWELESLSRTGFLEQPHHSAGRVPSDKGYEFFVERVLATDNGREGAFQKNMHSLLLRRHLADLAGELSSELGLLSVAGEPRKESFYKKGLEKLVGHFDSDGREDIKSAIRDFVEIEERLAQVSKKMEWTDNNPKVFVGKKSPVTKSKNLSVIMKNDRHNGEQVVVLAIGPKRMDYRKALRIFKNL